MAKGAALFDRPPVTAQALHFSTGVYILGLLTASATWNGYRIPLFLGLLALTLNAKRLWLVLRRTRIKRRGNNQHLYHGLPVGEFAAWLTETRAFKVDEASAKWGLSQGAYKKIAEELEEHGVLARGPNNARVLRDIPLADLVRQLRDKFPLAWSEERQLWYEKNGTLERWAISQDFQRRKLEEETARKERKLEKIEEKLGEARSSFQDVMALWA